MWVMQKNVLTQLPDDVPLPAGSRVVDVPEEFRRNPRGFRIVNGRLVRAKPEAGAPTTNLTRQEVAKLKRALASGAIGGTRAAAKEPQDPAQRTRKKEEK